MTKASKKPAKKPAKPSIFYVLCWKTKFTLLEDFVLKILEKNVAHDDAEIAAILCLNAADIPDIVGSDRLKESVQGDASRRTLMSGFTRMEFAVSSNEEYRAGKRYFCSANCLDFLRPLKLGAKEIPAELKSKKAGDCYELDLHINMPGEIRDALTEFRPVTVRTRLHA
ncbi:MAG: hypothetical protein OD918_02925 [Gammaproteobacteria bacterium]